MWSSKYVVDGSELRHCLVDEVIKRKKTRKKKKGNKTNQPTNRPTAPIHLSTSFEILYAHLLGRGISVILLLTFPFKNGLSSMKKKIFRSTKEREREKMILLQLH